MCADEPGTVVGARKGSPLVVGVGDGEYFLASDVAPIVEHTRQVVYLDDGEMAVLTPDGFHTATIAHERGRQGDPRGGVGPRPDREGRVRPLHAQGDLRAARRGAELDARPLNIAEGLARLGGLNMTPEELRDDPAHHHPRLRHLVARRADRRVHARGARADPGRGRVRLRVPLPQPDRRRRHRGARDLPVGRDRRHAGGDARGAAQGRARARHRQRGGLDDRARVGRRRLHPRRARDRRRLDQGVHLPGHVLGAAHAGARPPARDVARGRDRTGARAGRDPRQDRAILAAQRRGARASPSSTSTTTTSSTWAAATTSRWRSRARSSSRRSPTSTPRAIRRPR